MARRSVSTSVFALGTGVLFQIVLLISGVGTAWLVGDIGRGILAYGAVVGTLSGTIAAGGIASAAAVAISRATDEDRPAVLAQVKRLALKRSLLATGAATIGLIIARDRITESMVPISLGTLIAAVGLVQLQVFVGTAQGNGRVNKANAGRLVAPVVYAAGILAAAVFRSDRGTELVDTIAYSWAFGWACALCFALWSGRRTATQSPGKAEAKNDFGKMERSHFFGSIATYEILRVDQLAAALLLSTAEVGIYTVSMSFTGLLKALAASFGIASLGDALARKSDAISYRPVVVKLGMIAGAAALLVAVIPTAISILLPDEFARAATPSRLLVLAAALAAARRMFVEMAKALEHPEIGNITEVLQVVVLFGVAIPLAGSATGVAAATLIALAASFIATSIWALALLRQASAATGSYSQTTVTSTP